MHTKVKRSYKFSHGFQYQNLILHADLITQSAFNNVGNTAARTTEGDLTRMVQRYRKRRRNVKSRTP